MMRRIEAEERLAALGDRAIASGAADKHDARRIIRRLEAAARGERVRAAKASPATLAGMGIAVVTAPPSSSLGTGSEASETDLSDD